MLPKWQLRPKEPRAAETRAEAPGGEPSHDDTSGADLPVILGASTRSHRLLLA